MAKGIASGFPLSCVAASRQIMDRWKVGTHGGTFGGNPVACAAAIATIKVLQEENLLENAAVRGRQLLAGLERIQKHHPVLGDVRGLGLMVGCEFSDPNTGEPDADTAKKVLDYAQKEGRLLLLGCGAYGNVLRLIPPLIVTEAQIDLGLEIIEKAIAAAV